MASEDRLAALLVGAQGRPVARDFIALVGNRAFDDQEEGLKLSFRRPVPVLEEVVADFISQHRVVQADARKARQSALEQILKARLAGGCDGDGVAITAQARREPKDVHFRHGRRSPRLASMKFLRVVRHHRGSNCSDPASGAA